MEKQPFTVQRALNIQADQLAGWKSVLKDEVYQNLHEYATRYNHKAETGWDVPRGTDLSNHVGNYILGWR